MSIMIIADPCEPETCQTVKDNCMMSNSCRSLHEDWEEKCTEVWNSTTNTCSEECKNATHELHEDPQGRKFKLCDCGESDPERIGPKEIAAARQCFLRKSKMGEICKFGYVGHCQKCAAKKGIDVTVTLSMFSGSLTLQFVLDRVIE